MAEDPAYLFWNARAGVRRNVRRHLRKGGDPNAVDPGGYPALHVAVLAGHADVVEELLLAGADPGAVDAVGKTALQVAREQDREDAAELISARLARA